MGLNPPPLSSWASVLRTRPQCHLSFHEIFFFFFSSLRFNMTGFRLYILLLEQGLSKFICCQGNSPQAISLARGIQQKLEELQDKCQRAVNNTERSGIRKPAHTVTGKMDQAQRWLNNPAVDDKGLGMYTARNWVESIC